MHSFWEIDTLLENDISIVGGGILGLWTAYQLSLKFPQSRISIYERDLYAAGATSRNAGFACFGSASEIISDRKQWGDDKTLEIILKRWQGIQTIEKIIGDQIDYNNYGGYELLFNERINVNTIDDINSFLTPIFNQPVFHFANDRLKNFGFGKEVTGILYNPLEGQLHSGKLVIALHKILKNRNVSYFSNSAVTNFESGSQPIFEINDKIKIKTGKLIFCTNAFIPNEELNIKPGRGQVIITEPIANLPWKGCFHFLDGYYYFRNLDNRILFGGGRCLDFEGETDTRFELNTKIQNDLLEKLNTIISPYTPTKIELQWSGIMAFSEDKTPVITAIGQNVLYAMNCNGMGVSLSPITAKDIANII